MAIAVHRTNAPKLRTGLAGIAVLGSFRALLRPVAAVAALSLRRSIAAAGAEGEVDMRSSAGEPLSPVAAGDRIQELDVVRGFALLGIFLVNVEFFNRAIYGADEGMPVGLTGLDWIASWFIAYFVQGKFWTIFSLLFGMGFAVMLTRAERADRAFLIPYLRRLLALAVFGALHFIFLWAGDILFSYAVAAGGLLVVLYGRWLPVLIALAILVGLAFIPGLGASALVAGGLAFIALLAIYMRREQLVNLRFTRLPLASLILWILGAVGAITSIVLWLVPGLPTQLRTAVTLIGAFLLLTAFLSARYHQPVELRSLRVGVSLYVLPMLAVIIVGTIHYLSPPDPDGPIAVPAAVTQTEVGHPPASGEPAAAAGDAATRRAERAKRLAERQDQKRNEERILSSGTYAEAVEMRARDFPSRIPREASNAAIVIGMFLIGAWFVRSGMMENVRAHMRVFRRLACYGLPLGIGLGLLGSLIATSRSLGDSHDGFPLASGLVGLGSLPASLGYVGLVVVALNSNSVFARIRVLAPVGRMALTNYLTQALVSTSFFYGYGAGQWGLARSWQVAFVAVVFALQVVFSHWWLARYRYGPMEWVWRAFTYRRIPAMRLSAPAVVPATA
jgi:uncharacterized membrane protein YeiB